MKKIQKNKLREQLAELEHEQWQNWSQKIVSEVMGNTLSVYEIGQRFIQKHQKWLPNWKHYSELDEKTKDFDREWADKALKIINLNDLDNFKANLKKYGNNIIKIFERVKKKEIGMRTSKIQELVDFYNSTKYYVVEHFSGASPKLIINYLQKNSGKIEDVIVIRRKKNGKEKNKKTS